MDLDTGQPFIFQRFGCPVCGARFATLAEKKHHIRDEHKRKGSRRAE